MIGYAVSTALVIFAALAGIAVGAADLALPNDFVQPDGSVAMSGTLEARDILPQAAATFGARNLQFRSGEFDNVGGSQVAQLVTAQYATDGEFAIFNTAVNRVAPSGVSLGSVGVAPFLPTAGGSISGNLDMAFFALTNVALFNTRDPAQFVNIETPMEGFLVDFVDANTVAVSSKLASQVVTTLTGSPVADRVLVFAGAQTVQQSAVPSDNVVRATTTMTTDIVPQFTASANVVADSALHSADLTTTAFAAANFALLAGATFTQTLRAPRFIQSAPPRLYATSNFATTFSYVSPFTVANFDLPIWTAVEDTDFAISAQGVVTYTGPTQLVTLEANMAFTLDETTNACSLGWRVNSETLTQFTVVGASAVQAESGPNVTVARTVMLASGDTARLVMHCAVATTGLVSNATAYAT